MDGQANELEAEDKTDPCAEADRADGETMLNIGRSLVERFHRFAGVAEGLCLVAERFRRVLLVCQDLLGKADGEIVARHGLAAGISRECEEADEDRQGQQGDGQKTSAGLVTADRLARRGVADRAEGAGCLAEAAVNALLGRDRHALARKRREQLQQHRVGADETAIGPANEHAQRQDHRSDEDDVRCAAGHALVAEAEEADERVVAADDKVAADGRVHDAQPQVDVGEEAQAMFQPGWHVDRLPEHDVLDRAQRANTGAEHAAEEQSGQERQHEDQGDCDGKRVAIAAGAVRHILDRTDRADAAGAVEAKVEQREDHHSEDAPPRALPESHPTRDGQSGRQQAHVDPVPVSGFQRRGDRLRHCVAALEVRREKTLGGHGCRRPQKQRTDCGTQPAHQLVLGFVLRMYCWSGDTREMARDGHCAAIEQRLQ